jgi:penicillin-insensitive murein endopeptidase
MLVWLTPDAEAPAIAATAMPMLSVAEQPKPLYVPELKAFPIANPPPISVSALADVELAEALKHNLTDVGSVSIGQAHRGSLYNGVQMHSSPFWELKVPQAGYGTRETVLALGAAIEEVNRMFPGTPRLGIGHLSHENGGWIRPHKSHQSGRDVDVGYYYTEGERWYVPASPENLDVPRTWALISAMLKVAKVDYVFVDRSLHAILRAEAERVGEKPGLVAEVFDGDKVVRPIMRHARGHATHLHVRFESPVAVHNAQRVSGKLGASVQRRGALLGALKQRARQQARAPKPRGS